MLRELKKLKRNVKSKSGAVSITYLISGAVGFTLCALLMTSFMNTYKETIVRNADNIETLSGEKKSDPNGIIDLTIEN